MIYLDNAATSFPKPAAVVNESIRAMRVYGGNPGRSGHSLSLAAANKVYECRSVLGETFGCDESGVVFTQNTTHAINLLIKGLLKRGDHVIISDMEHNSVYRPIYKRAKDGIISFSVFNTLVNDKRRDAHSICAEIAKHLRPRTRLLICAASSNICSASLPIYEIGAFCKRHKIFFALDAAQVAGHTEIDMRKCQADAICIPSHKGLLGPMGCGALLLSDTKNTLLDTLTEGGNGMSSLLGTMPLEAPERYETGTLPLPAIAGLCEGVKFVNKLSIPFINEHERLCFRRARDIISSINGAKIYAPEYEGAVLLFELGDLPSEEVASALDRSGICVRAGFHCSALGHQTLGTSPKGAVRLSFGYSNKPNDADALYSVLKTL